MAETVSLLCQSRRQREIEFHAEAFRKGLTAEVWEGCSQWGVGGAEHLSESCSRGQGIRSGSSGSQQTVPAPRLC